MNTVLLIDGDLLVYRCGFAAEKTTYTVKDMEGKCLGAFPSNKEMQQWAKAMPEQDVVVEKTKDIQPLAFALNNVSTTVDAICARFPGSSMEMYITGKNNFRDKVATLQKYKGNRENVPKPVHYKEIREFLCGKYGGVVVDGEEADDRIGIRATTLGESSIIVSTDKDLDTIPGWHFNWVEKVMYYLTPEESMRKFYMQILTGDSTDNIRGISGCGRKTAEKILHGITKPKGLWQAVLAAYVEAYPDGCDGLSAKDAALENARLVYIRQRDNEEWQPP